MVFFPELTDIPIKAKVDTGARTTALHAFNVEKKREKGKVWVYFDIHPIQKSARPTKRVKAKFIEERTIKSSVGTETVRPVVDLEIDIGGKRFRTEVTLVNRDMMGFRLLIGRQTLMNGKYLVDVSHSFLTHPKTVKKLKDKK